MLNEVREVLETFLVAANKSLRHDFPKFASVTAALILNVLLLVRILPLFPDDRRASGSVLLLAISVGIAFKFFTQSKTIQVAYISSPLG